MLSCNLRIIEFIPLIKISNNIMLLLLQNPLFYKINIKIIKIKIYIESFISKKEKYLYKLKHN